uniref:SRCR domain-containing protein n=1 Tax=Knipowitschia caucasica TaxID=637954 RepID=A0AAV2M1L9_KNICA
MKLGESPWEKVCFSGDLPLNIRTKLCEELGCEGPTDRNGLSEVLKLNYSLESCSKDHQHIKFCLSMDQCTKQPAQLYCKGYEPPLRSSGPSVLVPVLLSLGLVLTLVIGGYFLLRFYLRRNNTSIKQLLPLTCASAAMFPKRVEEDFESGEYEDPPNLSKDIFAHDDALAVGGAAEKMSSSLSYDNVDDLTQQLTSGSPEHQEDSDQDSYDDIDVVVQTTAEIHPQHPLGGGGGGEGGEGGGGEGDGESADLIPGEDDYLVPPGGQP